MNIMWFQILFLLISLFAIANDWKRKRDGQLGQKGAFFWILFWVVADLAALYPNSTTVIANHFGIGRGADFILYIALAAIFYLLFKLHIKIEILGRDVTKVVRRDALETERKQ